LQQLSSYFRRLGKVNPPISANNSSEPGGYDPSFFDQLASIEEQHFWFRARNRLIHNLTKKISSHLKRGYRVLEVGCGTGNVLYTLRDACPEGMVVGLELWFDGLLHARKRSNGFLVQGDVRQFPFNKQFDLIGMFDVLEHIHEERQTLASLFEILAPGGRLLLTVPAHKFLWSYFDEAAHHCRRYSSAEIRDKLTAAGFEVEFLSQFMAFIFPIVWLLRKMSGLRKSSDAKLLASQEFRVIPVANQILTVILDLEARWVARGYALPIGTSLVVVARKPESAKTSAGVNA
jgi:SAM-dependent methyltransferase